MCHFCLCHLALYFPSNDLMSFPKLSVSDLLSAKCVVPRRIGTTSVNSKSNHFACHQRSFGNMVGWAASCSGGICWAPDISVLGTLRKEEKDNSFKGFSGLL